MIRSPAEHAPARLLAYPDSTERRLRRALRELDAALAGQRQAVASFRDQIGTLGGAVIRLEERAKALRGALGGLAAETGRAHAAARDLMATADTLESLTRR